MHDFTLLILPGAYASSVAVSLDILAAAAALAPRVGVPPPTWRIYAPARDAIELAHGLILRTASLPSDIRRDNSVWIIPGLGLTNSCDIGNRLTHPDAKEAIATLRKQARNGRVIAASCSAVFLLQAADLLVGKKVTTSWWLAPDLQRMEPRCNVDATRMIISDGAVTTAGAAFSQTDLMLHLLRSRCGAKLADAVCQALLLDQRQSQSPYMVPALFSSGNELISKLTAFIDRSLPHAPTVPELARKLHISERTLARHVRAATGSSPLDLVQRVRLGKARSLLESSRLPIQQVAERVGYGDANALRKAMKKIFGVIPSQLRRTSYSR